MNRKLILGLFVFAVTSNIKGQVAEWLIPPMYDNIHMAEGESLIITDSLEHKIIWSQSGKRLSVTKHQMYSFKEGYSVTTRPHSDIVSGFFDREGKFTPIADCNVTYSMPYFSDMHLLVHDGTYFRFVNTNGIVSESRYEKAYPFSNGYASCFTYANLEKKKDPYNLLISKDEEQITFSFNGKSFDNEDIDFISSINDENIGIVVAKGKLYYFNARNKTLSPIFAKKNETNIKNQAKLENDISQSITNDYESVYILHAKCGKKDRIQIKLNKFMVPLSISLTDGEYVYNRKEEAEIILESMLEVVNNKQEFGINWKGMEVLPPQFSEVITCFDDKALVRLDGKCGMLKVLKDEKFKISINKDQPIAFKHKTCEATIRLDMPKIISTSKTWIEVDPKTGCEIDMQSEDKKETSFGNTVQYKCVLSIPESLPDIMHNDERNGISYPTRVFYDGLKSPIIPYKVMAWHYKYFNVDVNDAETSIHQGTLSFTLNINAEREPGETVYPTIVNIQTDSLQCELEKISETRYKCKVFELNEGNNTIVVQIHEEGCPAASFPFEVTYTKPAVKTRNKAAVKEDVVIKKKTQKTTVTTLTPHLEI